MKTKIILLASILSLIVIGSIVGFAVFGGDKECSHQWGEWSTTISATCTQSGTQEHKCSKCGETQSSTIEALGHDWSEATCSAPKTCKICSATEGTASAHTYTVETVKEESLKIEATCTQAAVYYKSCSCGAISTSEEDTFVNGEALEHIDENNLNALNGEMSLFDIVENVEWLVVELV